MTLLVRVYYFFVCHGTCALVRGAVTSSDSLGLPVLSISVFFVFGSLAQCKDPWCFQR